MSLIVQKAFSYFLRGLLALLPLIVTLYLLLLLLKFVGAITGAGMHLLPLSWRSSPTVITTVQVITGLMLFSFIVAMGYWIRGVAGKIILSRIDALISSIPAVRVVYRTTRQLIDLFSIKRDQNLMKPVMVEWPSDGRWVLAFVTGVAPVRENDEKLFTVFMPTSPNPTSGYLLLLPEKRLKTLDLPFETAMKMVLTAGMVQS